MRWLPPLLFVLFFVCLVLSLLPPSEAAVERARAHGFSESVIADGQTYSLGRRAFLWAATLVQLAWLCVLVFGDLGKRVAQGCERLVRGRWLPAVLLMGAFCYLSEAALHAPFAVARWRHSTAWGMSVQPLVDWLRDYAIEMGVGAAVELIVLTGLYLLLRCWPRMWWVPATLGAMVLAALFAFVLPIVVAPLFNTFTPIGATKWASSEAPLRKLIGKADVEVKDVLVMNASRQTRHTNAYFTGFGSTRRIVLYDNLLDKHSLPEVESILAHEVGHWWHDHIMQGIAYGGLAALAGFFLLSRILQRATAPFELRGPSDPAGLPIILLAFFLGSWAGAPLANAVSRHFERQADEMSLKLAGQPEVFIETERKLAIDNVSNVTPTLFNVWLFSTHPPAVERMEMGEAWKSGRMTK